MMKSYTDPPSSKNGKVTLPETNMAPENRPLPFVGARLVLGSVLDMVVLVVSVTGMRSP